MYPEGTRNNTNRPLLPIQKGAAFAMHITGTPAVLLSIIGTDKILPKGCLIPKHFRKVNFVFGDKIFYQSDLDLSQNTKLIQNNLEALVVCNKKLDNNRKTKCKNRSFYE